MFELRMSLQSLMVALALVLIFMGPGLGMAAPLGEPDDEAFDMENYDLNSETDWENLDINIYGDSYDYDDLDQEIEVGTVAPDTPPPEHHEEEVTLPSQPTLPPAPVTLDFKGPGLFGPETGLEDLEGNSEARVKYWRLKGEEEGEEEGKLAVLLQAGPDEGGEQTLAPQKQGKRLETPRSN
eukprot:superscaffoldBa00002805_g15341